jgi:hypothetical protein
VLPSAPLAAILVVVRRVSTPRLQATPGGLSRTVLTSYALPPALLARYQHPDGRVENPDGELVRLGRLNPRIDQRKHIFHNQRKLCTFYDSHRFAAAFRAISARRSGVNAFARAAPPSLPSCAAALAGLGASSCSSPVATALTYVEAGDAWHNNITGPVFGGGPG